MRSVTSAWFARAQSRAPRCAPLAHWVVPLWAALALLAFPTGCEEKKKEAPKADEAQLKSAPDKLKIAFAYVGPVGDAGWTFAHDRGRKAVETQFRGRVVTSFVENVPEAADAERVLRDLVSQGNTLIFGTTFGYMESMLRVAKNEPAVRFEHATGYKTADNMRTYDSRTYEGAYLAGIVAGAMTSSKILGVVASIPIPEVVRNIDSFTLGAQSIKPEVKVKVVWINKWFDPPREAEGAQSLLDQGADVLFQNTDSSAVLQTAEKAGKYAFGWDSDMSKFGPHAHLGSAIINWAPYYIKAVKDALDGTWKTGSAWWGVREGAIDFVSISSKVPSETKQRLDDVKQRMRLGTFHPWTGPILDQSGKELLRAGEQASDDFLRGLKSYVRGVEGNLPS
jgi:basic membrane protein A and related proteins